MLLATPSTPRSALTFARAVAQTVAPSFERVTLQAKTRAAGSVVASAWRSVCVGWWLVLAATLSTPALSQSQNNNRDSNDSSTGSSAGSSNSNQNNNTGPVRLRQNGADGRDANDRGARSRSRDSYARQRDRMGSEPFRTSDMMGRDDDRLGPKPSEFELFVQKLSYPEEVRRFGAELMTPRDEDMDVEASPTVPTDYVVKPGDELMVTIWGSVDGDLRLLVDRSGRVSIPRVGAVPVAGTKYADLQSVLTKRVGQVFRNFELSVSLGSLRGLRVYVTGYVARPGAYSVSSLSTITNALMQTGGPAAAGSFRNIQLRRAGKTIASFDLYDLLLKGDRGADQTVQADDVIHVGPVGREVALIGSVNRAAIFELLPGETVGDLLQMAGGYSAVADRSRLAIERLDDRSGKRITQLEMPTSQKIVLASGDVVRAFSAVDAALPVQRQNKRVRIEGEVVRPGDYVLPPQSTLADALAIAGGTTDLAFAFGAEFMRESVRITQQQNYERALRDLETEFARYNSGQRTSSAEDAAAQAARATSATRLVERMRAVKPTGRVVLQLAPDSKELPTLTLEDGDRLYIPPRPTSVGVFGSVFSGGSYLYGDGRQVEDFLRLAGGPTRGADPSSMFVIRANGSVVSNREKDRWYSRASGLADVRAEPGDTIFVPEELDKTTFTQHAKDWGQIVSQFGLGLAAILALTR